MKGASGMVKLSKGVFVFFLSVVLVLGLVIYAFGQDFNEADDEETALFQSNEAGEADGANEVYEGSGNLSALAGDEDLQVSTWLSISAQSGVESGVLASVFVEAKVDTATDGVLIILPAIPDPLTGDPSFLYTAVPDAGTSAVELKKDFEFMYGGSPVHLDCALLMWVPTYSSSLHIPNREIQYLFPNGLTANGTELQLTAYILEAEGVSNNSAGLIKAGGLANIAKAADRPILKAIANEAYTVTKTTTIPVSAADQNFTGLRDREYGAVVSPASPENDWTVTWKLSLQNNKLSNDTGRFYMDDIVLHDTISGYMGSHPAISVKDGNGLAVNASNITITHPNANTTAIEVLTPGGYAAASPVFNGNYIYNITAVFSKNDFTNHFGQTPALSAPKAVTNKATVSYKPHVNSTESTSAESAQTVSFGWNQKAPTLPTLTLTKSIEMSGQVRGFTEVLSGIYEGPVSNVEFTLQPQPSGTPIKKKLTFNVTGASLSFENIPPGTYRLTESTGIANFSTTSPASMASPQGALIEVSQPSPVNGASTISVDGTAQGIAAKIDVIDTSTTRGFIKVYTKQQNAFEYPATYVNYEDVLQAQYESLALMYGAAQVPGYTKVRGKDSAGTYVLFENAPVSPGTYTLSDANTAQGVVLSAVSSGTPAVYPPADKGNFSVVVSQASAGNYTAFYDSNKGGFAMGKIFYNASGTAVTVSNYEADFKLYRDAAYTQPLTANAVDFTMTQVTHAQGTAIRYITETFDAGTYYLKEVGLRSGGTDISGDYILEQSGTVTITITQGEYKAILGSTVSGKLALGSLPWGGTAQGVLINKSNYGQLSIKNFNANGAAVNSSFIVTGPAGYGTNGTKTITTSGGAYTENVPAGTYTITTYNSPTNGVLYGAMGGNNAPAYPGTLPVTVVVNSSTQAVAAVTVANPGTITPNASVQTAAFVWKYKPQVRGTKKYWTGLGDARNNITATSQFTVYKLNAAGTDYERTSTVATAGANGWFSTAALDVGSYILVETNLPNAANITEPAYWSVFKSGSLFLTSIAKTAAEAAMTSSGNGNLMVSITGGDFGETSVPVVWLGGSEADSIVMNIPKNTVTFNKSAMNSDPVPGAVFAIYGSLSDAQAETGAVSSLTTNAAGSASFTGLLPGTTYYIREATAPHGFMLSSAVLKVAIDSKGQPDFSWIGTPPPGSTDVFNTTTPSAGTTQVNTVLVFTNIKSPEPKFIKIGETNAFEEPDFVSRETMALPGAKFTLTDKDGFYWAVSAGGDMYNTGSTSYNPAYDIVSGAGGLIDVKGLDPSKQPYDLIEIWAPSPTGVPPGQEYKLVKIKINIDPSYDGSGYDIWVQGAKWRDIGEGYWEIKDKINPHSFKVSKLPIKLSDGASMAGGFDVDSSVADLDQIGVYSAQFKIWTMKDDPANPGQWIKDRMVDTVTIGGGSITPNNDAWSRDLPPGMYWIEEVKSPFFHAGIDSWPAGARGDQDTSVYIYLDGTDPGSKDDIAKDRNGSTNWAPAEDHGYMIEIKEDDDEIIKIVFGNSNQLTGGGMALHRYIRLFGQKDGSVMGRSGLYEFVSKIGGAEFEVYPAYVDAAGVYHRFPTIDDKPLTTVTSSFINDANLSVGQFITNYFDITQAFYYGGADWDNTFDQYLINETGYTALAPEYRVASYPEIEGAIDWAQVSPALIQQYANSYQSWSIVLVETENSAHIKQNGGTYDYDPANPPTFGFDFQNKNALLSTYYENGSNPPGLAAGVDPEPYHFNNYRGTGYLEFVKKSSEGINVYLADSVIELYRVNANDIDQSTGALIGTKLNAYNNADYYGTVASNAVGPGLTGAAGTARLTLSPGYYIAREITPAPGHNDWGDWTANSYNGTQWPNTVPKSGSFTTGLDNGGAVDESDLIGPVVVFAAQTDGVETHSTVLTLINKAKPTVNIINTWNGTTLTNTDFVGYYNVTVPAGSGIPTTLHSAGNNYDNSGSLRNLPDGNYTVALDYSNPISIQAAALYVPNAAMRPDSSPPAPMNITFTVSGGNVVLSSVLLGGTAMPANQAAGLAAGGVWNTGAANGVLNIYVNHRAVGSLVILKGGLDAAGQPTQVLTGLTSATFDIEYADGPNTGAFCKTVTWSSAAHLKDGLRVALDPGLYKVTETGVANAAFWNIDTAPVYIKIGASGEVYLQNNRAFYGAVSSETAPLVTSDNPARAQFFNNSTEGVLRIKKLGAKSSIPTTPDLQGAKFDVYPTSLNGTSPTGAKVNTAPVEYNTAKLGYFISLPEGYYLVKETEAPAGYALRDDYVYVEVTGSLEPVWNGYGDPSNRNVVDFLDPRPLTIYIAKETTYKAIGNPGDPGYIPAREQRVERLPIYLWQRTGGAASELDKANFELVAYGATYAASQAGSGADIGRIDFDITEAGIYRVTEALTPEHEHLTVNPAYRMNGYTWNVSDNPITDVPSSAILGSIANKDLVVEYDEATNSLRVKGTDANVDWDAAEGTLTINNAFLGWTPIAQKLDYLTGKMVTGSPGATFALYLTEADARADTNRIETKTDSAGAGYVRFDPRYSAYAETLWVREVAPPAGYILDTELTSVDGYTLEPWYDVRVKRLHFNPANPADDVGHAVFKNGRGSDNKLTIDKYVQAGKAGDTVTPVKVQKPLAEEGFSTTYQIVPGELENTMPVYNFTVKDALSFRSKSEGAIGGSAANQPTYTITQVRIGPVSTLTVPTTKPPVAYRSAAAQKADTDPATGLYIADNRAPVWASVNGDWKLLSASAFTSFAVPAGTDSLEIVYSGFKPNGIEIPAVGARFSPGMIEVDVTFDRFSPDSGQHEVAKIVNTARVNAEYADGATLSAQAGRDQDTAIIALDIPERPTMTMSKQRINYTPGEKLYAGDKIDYEIVMKNISLDSGTDPIRKPVIIDYMSLNEMSIAIDSVTNDPIYKVYKGESGGLETLYAGAILFNQLDGNVVMWSFPELTLKKGDWLRVEFSAQTSHIVTATNLLNEAYGTSAAPLVKSLDYPTGASFVAENMADRNSVYADTASVPARDDWDKLDGITGFEAGDYGLFARAAANAVQVTRSSAILFDKGVKLNDSISFSDTIVDATLDDVVTFRLAIQNDQNSAVSSSSVLYSIANLRIVDVLPFPGDTLTNMQPRGTDWSQGLLDVWKLDTGSIKVYTSSGGLIPGYYYNVYGTNAPVTNVNTTINSLKQASFTGALTGDATALVINFGNEQNAGPYTQDPSRLLIPTGDVLYVEYSMYFDKTAAGANDFNSDLYKIAANNFTSFYQVILDRSGPTLMEESHLSSNTADVRYMVPDVRLEGFVWHDTDGDGHYGSDPLIDIPMSGIPVELYMRSKGTTGGGALIASTSTDQDGAYSFGSLSSSYLDLEYMVRVYKPANLDPDHMWVFTEKHAYSLTPGNDSDINKGVKEDAYGDSDWIEMYQDVVQLDAGMYQLNALSGLAWSDNNHDGARQTGENGIEGMKASLYYRVNSGWALAVQTTTDPNGFYSFPNIEIGSYYVLFNRGDIPGDIDRFAWTKENAVIGAGDLGNSIAVPTPAQADYRSLEAKTGTLSFATGMAEAEVDAGLYPVPKVTYYPNGGSGSWGGAAYSIYVLDGELVPNQNVSRGGYTFRGWYLLPNDVYRWQFGIDRMTMNDIELKAHWERRNPPGPGNPPPTVPPVTPQVVTPGEPTVEQPGEPPVVELPPLGTVTIGDDGVPQDQGKPVVEIPDKTLPLAAFDSWSLISCIMSIAAVIIALGMLIGALSRRKREDEEDEDSGYYAASTDDGYETDEKKRQKTTAWTIAAIIIGLLVPIVWLYLDWPLVNMTLVNRWTPIVAIFFAAHIVVTIIHKTRKEKPEEGDESVIADDMV